MSTLSLPWPPKELSPNARVHWSKKHKAGKKQYLDAALMTPAADVRKLRDAPFVSVALTFCPPGAYHFDLDNLVARMKWALDGIAAGIGMDDRNFRLEAPVIARPKPPHGEVIVTLTPLAKQEAA